MEISDHGSHSHLSAEELQYLEAKPVENYRYVPVCGLQVTLYWI
jgi:hypothetical protein